ncbi:MAG: M3 family metallopeptidase, partial [Pseudomonadota bacterium]
GLEFSDNILAENNNYFLDISDSKDLEGIPPSIQESFFQKAKARGKEGWSVGLDGPSYVAFMTYADNRKLREKLFRAFNSRAFKKEKFDNRKLLKKIIKLRHARAQLLGYPTHAHFVLERRMAGNPDKVKDFLDEIGQHALPVALKDVAELQKFVLKQKGPKNIQRWDFLYWSEKWKKEKFSIDEESLRAFFSLDKTLQGVFLVTNKLYGLTFHPSQEIERYHSEVQVYEVRNSNGEHQGILYADFFPRPGKRGGAWMSSFRGQKKEKGKNIRPHVSIVGNFSRPTGTAPSLLTFDEVKALFHEFGHALHSLLSDCTYKTLSGANVYWDFVELPSQILENWAFEKECLDLFAQHYQTGEKIPEKIVQSIIESSNFLESYNTVRQLSFAYLDQAWHTTDPQTIKTVDQFENSIMEKNKLLPDVVGTNFSCAYTHVFSGSYSAGYYSYKWSEVLDADAFDYFKEKGIFNQEVAAAFNHHILSRGGSEHPMELYKRFRGRGPSVTPLLKRAGLITNP